MTVHGHDGLDEITITGPTFVAELKHDFITEYTIEPKQFGLDVAPIESIQVKDAAESRARLEAVLANEPGPSRDIVVAERGRGALRLGRRRQPLGRRRSRARCDRDGRRAREARRLRDVHARVREGGLSVRHPRAHPRREAPRGRGGEGARRRSQRSRRARARGAAAARIRAGAAREDRRGQARGDRRDQAREPEQGPDPRRFRSRAHRRAPTRRTARPACRC